MSLALKNFIINGNKHISSIILKGNNLKDTHFSEIIIACRQDIESISYINNQLGIKSVAAIETVLNSGRTKLS